MLIIDIGALQLSIIVSSILCFTFMLQLTTTQLQLCQTTGSSDDTTDYIIRLAHQYEYNSRGLLHCRYTSFISNNKFPLHIEHNPFSMSLIFPLDESILYTINHTGVWDGHHISYSGSEKFSVHMY